MDLDTLMTEAARHGAEGRPREAAEAYRRIVLQAEAAYGPQDPTVVVARAYQGLALMKAGDAAGARPLLEDALPVLREELPPGHPGLQGLLNAYAAALEGEAEARLDAGDAPAVRLLLERALELAESAPAPDPLHVAWILNHLGDAHTVLADTAAAQACLARALEILLAAVGPDHPLVGHVHLNLGELRRAEGDYDEAIRALEQALRIVRGSPDAGPLLVAQVLERLSAVLSEGGHFTRAQAAAEEAWEIHEAAGDTDSEGAAHTLMSLGNTASTLGDDARAESLQRRGMEIFRTVCGPEHRHTVHGAVNLAVVLGRLGRYPEARTLLEGAIAVQERLSPGHPDLAWSLSALGALLHDLGDDPRARLLLDRAYQIDHEVLGPGHPSTVRTLSNLAGALRALGQAAEARTRLEASLRMQEAEYGPDHPLLANTLSLLGGLLYTDLSDPEGARAYLARAHGLLETAFGPGHPETAEALMNLALTREEPTERCRALEEACAAWEAALGPRHPKLGIGLVNLSAAWLVAGEFARAARCAERALEVMTPALGVNNLYVARALDARVWARVNLGDPAEALPDAERVRVIVRRTLGPAHPEAAMAAMGVAMLRHVTGTGDAMSAALEALRIGREHARTVLPALSLAEQNLLTDRLVYFTNTMLVCSHDVPLSPAEHALVAGQKGLLLHGLQQQRSVARIADDVGHPAHATAQRLLAVRQALAAHFRREAAPEASERWQAAYDRLTREKEALERGLAALLAKDGPKADPLDALGGGVGRLLAPDEALVDVHRYWRFMAVGDSVEHYAAFVVRPDGFALRVELGEAARVDDALEAWRAAVLARGDAAAELDSFAQRVWAPVAATLPESARRVWISPDGQLTRFPWPVLVDTAAAGRLLAVVDAPRDLARLRASHAPDADDVSSILLVGGIDFGPRARPLPGTGREVRRLETLARAAGFRTVSLTGFEPTRAAVMEALPRARLAHLATHGSFALDEEPGRTTRDLLRVLGRQPRHRPGRNPLLGSALLLARTHGGSNAWITAEELVGLDLSGTTLVVLSACNTGRGRELNGKGVMGLRASFLAAGVRTLLMSLWAVPDAKTALLMERFYHALWHEGLAPAEALRHAQEAVRAEFREPYWWAAWVLVGESW